MLRAIARRAAPGRCRCCSLCRVKRALTIPTDAENIILRFGDRDVRLTNLKKLFWKKLKITKRDLLQYYADISPWLLPHIEDRAMVMKRYPNGAEGDFFYMKRAPDPRPEWIEICDIDHGSAGRINFPMIQDLPALLWVINLGSSISISGTRSVTTTTVRTCCTSISIPDRAPTSTRFAK